MTPITESKVSAPESRRMNDGRERTEEVPPQVHPWLAARGIAESQPLRAADILVLQRSVGNRAVQRLLASRLADRVGRRDANGVAQGADSAVEHASSSIGLPLPDSVRGPFERSLGDDLSGVRVHTGAKSLEAADAIGAKAYRVGQDIHFGASQYAPTTQTGLHLLAHEVAHTVQNRGRAPVRQEKLEVSNPADPAEVEADRVADAIVAAGSPEIGSARTALRRDENASAAQTGDTSSVQRQQPEYSVGSHLLQRDPKAVTPPAAQPAAPDQHYLVGNVSYTEKQYEVAVGQVADLWTAANGIIAKQKTAVSRFCGKGAAGADKEPDLFESVFSAAVLAIIGVATDGIGLAVGAAAEAGIGKLISLLPKAIDKHSVEAVTKKVLDVAIDKGKEKAKEAAKKKLEAAPSTPSAGSRKLATPLASLQAALEDSIDRGGGEEKKQTLQTLLANENMSPPEAKWVAAAALYDGLTATIDLADEVQWNATSDAWLIFQQASGRGTTAAVDIGRVLIDLNNTYPNVGARVDAAYLAGQGVNETTLEPYNQRALGDIAMTKLVSMDGGHMGRGWVECQWKMLIGADNSMIDVKGTNRYGSLWLAAHGVGKEDLDFDDAEYTTANAVAGAQKVWDTIKGRTTKFKEAGMTSGPGPW